ncbi:MAG: glycosyltransferase, partial [Flavobacterium sp.]
MNRKIAIILSHPIQYYSPFFAALNDEGFVFKVFYTLGDSDGIDAGFGKQIMWDLPLLQHYDYEFLSNMSSEPGSNHYNGIISPDLISTVERYNPEVILIYGWAYAAHLKAMKYFHSKVPIWFKGDSTLLDDLPYWKKITRKIALTYVYRHIDKAFYVGSNNYDYFRSFGLKNNQLIFAPHAIDNQRFAEDKFIHAEKIKKKLNISPDDIIVLFAGKFQAKKNPEILLKAFKSMKLDNVHLLMVGNGILEEKLKYKSQQLGLKSQKIHFMDFQNQSQMPAVYQACDIYC